MDTLLDRWPLDAASARLPGVSFAWRAHVPEAGLGSGVPVFVGFVAPAAGEPAAPPRALRLTRWEQWSAALPQGATGHLDYAVRGFFDNGGSRCWVWPLALPAGAGAAERQRLLQACFDPGSPLEDLSDPDLVCVPDADAAGDAAAVRALQQAVLAHCTRLNDRLALLDCLPPAAGTPAARTQFASRPGVQPANGALYWPWVLVSALPRDAARGDGLRCVPPCGHVAGVIARGDAAAGRHKAPANEPLHGTHDVDAQAPAALLAELSDEGVNCLRVLPGRGVMVCGARTLSTRPDLRPLGTRRVVLGLARWAELGLRDLVMETHEPALWERIRQRVRSWCQARYQEGLLHGDTPEEAYFVQCDAETNPPAQRELGRVTCRVGLAASVPAEFIVLQLIQSADGAALSG